MPQNSLAHETSPYLLQHADNPVDWLPWGPEAMERARREDKPILLSVGYAACHWCHVMAHESFEDDTTARLMNQWFVNVKVDREERPDIDTIYQSALAMLGQQGGWPLTMFLTPDGEPFWGGTYFPPTSRYGRPAFADVLKAIAGTYGNEPEKVDQNVQALREALEKLAQNQRGGAIDATLLNRIAERLVREVDPQWGGIGGPPKFPQPSILEQLWRAYKRTGESGYRHAVLLTLTRLCQGGIYDHLGGGFARYATDGEWLVPHFEKMLYDNAQLIALLTHAWQETRAPLFETRLRETVTWALREMVAPGGGFAATYDADSEGEEGRFYVWTEAEVDALLGAEAPSFKAVYEVTPDGNWEGKTILNRRRQDGLADPAMEARLAESRAALKAVRDRRVWPGWDDKVLADWNGLMIAALAEAGLVFDEPDWIAAAERAYGFVCEHMVEDGRLRQSWRQGRARHTATLDAYANMIRAALALYEAQGLPGFLAQARHWADQVDRWYWDGDHGGYFLTAADAEALIVRTKSVHDSAVPSGNGTMLGVLIRLYLLTGAAEYRDRADALHDAFSGEVNRNIFPLSTFLNSIDLLHDATQVVIVGDRRDDDTKALMRTVLDRSLPNRLLVTVSPDEPLADPHPAAGKGQVDGRPAAYVCRGMTCAAPVTDAAGLAALLDG